MTNQASPKREIFKLQSLVTGILLLILAVILTVLYFQDCQREWRLREEQTTHRLELAFELVSREMQRVRADVIFIANQEAVRAFDADRPETRDSVEQEFANLLEFKQVFEQVRLIDRRGNEVARVELVNDEGRVIASDRFQDKSDRYYFRESLNLVPGEVFVSDFDLNQERGEIERPLNPVIRFVTPVQNEDGPGRYLLVANYRGTTLLNDLSSNSLPGHMMLIRNDGEYLLAPEAGDSWGWLLGHEASFDSDFPKSWQLEKKPKLTFVDEEGAIAYQRLRLGQEGKSNKSTATRRQDLFLVSRIPPAEIYENSKQLLLRLLLFMAAILLPLLVLTRLWAVAFIRRKQQNSFIQQSESRLRELSSRLVRIQEDERKAISREIHDQLGQQVTALNLDLKLLKQKLDPPEVGVDVHLQRSISISEDLLEALHDFASRVRPVELDDLGLHDAVESHLQDFEKLTGIDFSFSCRVNDIEVSSVVAENVFRLVQESLNNVLKHADATHVEVSIKTIELRGLKCLSVQIQDNGVGADELSNGSAADVRSVDGSARLGILGMRERVDLLGGSLTLTSKPDQGTKVDVSVPLV